MARSKVSAALGVLVFRKVGVVPVPIRHFFDFVPLLAQHDKLLLAPFRGALGFVDPRKGLAVVTNTSRRQSLEAFSSHRLFSFQPHR